MAADNHPATTAKRWFIRREGKIAGPFNSLKIRRFIAAQRLQLNDEVSKDKNHWQPLSEVAELLPPSLRQGDQEMGCEGHSPFPLRPLLTALSLILAITAASFLLDQPTESSLPNCHAAPAPGVNWNSCQLSHLSASQADLRNLTASNANLDQAQLSGAQLDRAQLSYARLSDADLSHSQLTSANLKGATLKGADLSYSDLTQANLRYADLSQANLGGAKLDKTLLDDAIWIDQRRCARGSVGQCLPLTR